MFTVVNNLFASFIKHILIPHSHLHFIQAKTTTTSKQLLPFSFNFIAISWHADPRECCFVGDDLESKLFYYFAFLTLWSVSGSLILSPLHEASRIK